MTHAELVFDAVRYRRHVGAHASSIRSYVIVREQSKHTRAQDTVVLSQLEDAGKVRRVGRLWLLSHRAHKRAKGFCLEPTWRPEDAWILLSALYNRPLPACKLEHLIATADFINHAIPNLAEMYGSLNRLAQAGLITEQDGVFAVTNKAVQHFAKVEAVCKKHVHAQLDGLRRLLDCPCCGVTLSSVDWRIDLDEATLKSAYTKYHETALTPGRRPKK
ncbi:MAG: hypothetical protein L0Y72_26550 [Gemmataceae bacterium]|nr:hypothetical protein [Gemmataceae bacterium]MCI0742609.1 hypothetical protein [Gemmataceae bacterium]